MPLYNPPSGSGEPLGLSDASWDKTAGGPSPADSGLLAWTFPFWVSGAAAGVALVSSQEVWAMRLHVQRSITTTNVVGDVGTAGASFTGNGAKFAIYSNDGATQLFVTADVSASLTSTGAKSLAFATPGALAAGSYWIAFWCNATTAPRFVGMGNSTPRVASTANQYVSRITTGVTDIPATITLNAAGGGSSGWFLGIS